MNSIIQYTYPRVSSCLPSLGFSARSPWSGLEGELDRWFETALAGFGMPSFDRQFPVDMYEDKDNTYVRAELPGVNRDDISVEMADGVLTIGATRKSSAAGDKAETTFAFNRSIAIPDAAQADKVSAAYENGVLTVTLPKLEIAKPKKITVAVN